MKQTLTKRVKSLVLAVVLSSCSGLMAQVVVADGDTAICPPGSGTLTATTVLTTTTNYNIAAIPYAPDPYNTGTFVAMGDDAVTGSMPIGFNFEFFGVCYSNFYIGSNGWVAFSPQATTFTSAPIPSANPAVPANCIMGPWQDWDPGVGAGPYINYQTLGVMPFRRLVVSWNNCPMFQCNAQLGTFQIVIYETTNVIENFILNKPACATWQGNTSVQGVHDPTRTIGLTVPGRNSTSWTAAIEGWRYTPNGIPTISWNVVGNPTVVGTGSPFAVSPTVNTSYVATVTDVCTGNSFTDTVDVTMIPPPLAGTITASDDSVCSGDAVTLTLSGNTGNSIQWQQSSNAITWFNIAGATTSTYVTGPLSSTLYYQVVIVGNGLAGAGCGTVTTPPVQITVTASPVADAGTGTSVCTGGCTNLTGTGGTTYTWNPGALVGQTVNVCPTGTTTYTLYITDINGCSDSDMVTINISVASVTASPSVSICNGGSTVLVASGPGGQTYAWLPSGSLVGANTANPTATPTTTTTYTVTATNAFGCTAVDSVLVQVTNAPPIVASADTALCNGGSATLSVSGATTYSWSPGNMTGNTVVVSPATTTTYVVTGTTNNCISTDTVVVNVSPPLVVSAGPDFSVCGGTQVTLNVGLSGATYSWSPAGSIIGSTTSQSILAAPTGNTSYIVNVTDANGCIATDTINVTVNPLPIVSTSSPDLVICEGSTALLNAVGAQSYVWTPNIALNSTTVANVAATPSNTTTYMVTGTDANGCLDTSTITVIVNPNPQASFTSTASACGGTTGSIDLFGIVGGTAPYTYQIGASPVTLPATGLGPGLYTVTYTDANGCTGLIGVTVFSIDPQITFTSVASECGDTSGQILVNQVVTGTAPFTYQIGTATVTMPVTGLAPGNYNVTYTDANGCTGLTGVTVFSQNTAYVNASADPNFGSYPLPVNFSATGSNGLNNWTWNFGDTNTGTGQNTGNTYGAPGTYTVVVVAWNDNPACAVTDTIYVTVVESATIALPNIFTPNEDASNDFFSATVAGVQEINVEIYDRWGAMIYSTKISGLSASPQIVQLWDGTNGGKTASDGVYYYVVTAIGYDLKPYPMQGFVHLVTGNE